MNCHANKCIECTVQQCAHHCENENYCSLDRILVGTHEVNPTVDQCTDCKSFRKKEGVFRGSFPLPRFFLDEVPRNEYHSVNIYSSFPAGTQFFHKFPV